MNRIFEVFFVAVMSLMSPAAVAQDIDPLAAISLAGQGVDAGQNFVDEAPDLIAKLFENGKAGLALSSASECLGRLQTYALVSAGVSNVMPFSRVWTFEGDRGPGMRVKLMINGNSFNGDIYCDNNTMKVSPPKSSVHEESLQIYSPSMLEVSIGTLILLQLQGVFDTDVGLELSAVEPIVDPKNPTEEGETASTLPNISSSLSTGEKEGLALNIATCWNRGSLSSEAKQSNLLVAVEMSPTGKPLSGSIELVEGNGGSDAAIKQAFEAARRAILRCGATGFNLPEEKYSSWKSLNLIFGSTVLVK